jgi:hypothetical protein
MLADACPIDDKEHKTIYYPVDYSSTDLLNNASNYS